MKNSRKINKRKTVLVLEVSREGYTTDQVPNTATIGELISALEQYDDDTLIYVSHDKGYTYGGIHIGWLEERWIEDEDPDV